MVTKKEGLLIDNFQETDKVVADELQRNLMGQPDKKRLSHKKRGMVMYTPAEWDDLCRTNYKEAAQIVGEKTLIILGSGQYNGLEGFTLKDRTTLEDRKRPTLEDLPENPGLEDYQQLIQDQRQYDLDLRHELAQPNEDTIKQMFKLLKLDPEEDREVVGMTFFSIYVCAPLSSL